LFQGVKRVKRVKRVVGQLEEWPLRSILDRRDMETTAPINSGILPGWRETCAWLSLGISSSIFSLVFSPIFRVLAA
jgi:hypothetical protein